MKHTIFLDTINIDTIIQSTLEAAKAIMDIYKKDFSVTYKEDHSPLTDADTKANEIICNFLQKKYPQIPILSEENKLIPYKERKDWNYYWCIDPIDGTKEFIKKNDEFTVNIALIHNHTPVLGVVYAPALGELYWAKKGEGAYKLLIDVKSSILNEENLVKKSKKLPLYTNHSPEKTLTIVASKSHLTEETQTFITHLTSDIQQTTLISKGSSLKLLMVAEGKADIYPRLAPTMEWDTAAADAIVREAGKMTYQYIAGESIIPLQYNKKNLLNPWFVVK